MNDVDELPPNNESVDVLLKPAEETVTSEAFEEGLRLACNTNNASLMESLSRGYVLPVRSQTSCGSTTAVPIRLEYGVRFTMTLVYNVESKATTTTSASESASSSASSSSSSASTASTSSSSAPSSSKCKLVKVGVDTLNPSIARAESYRYLAELQSEPSLASVIFTAPCALLRGVTLVDLPGTGDSDERKTKNRRDFLTSAAGLTEVWIMCTACTVDIIDEVPFIPAGVTVRAFYYDFSHTQSRPVDDPTMLELDANARKMLFDWLYVQLHHRKVPFKSAHLIRGPRVFSSTLMSRFPPPSPLLPPSPPSHPLTNHLWIKWILPFFVCIVLLHGLGKVRKMLATWPLLDFLSPMIKVSQPPIAESLPLP